MKVYIRLVGKVHFHKASLDDEIDKIVALTHPPMSFTVNNRVVRERDVAEMYDSTEYYTGSKGAVRKRDCCNCCDNHPCNQPLME